MKMKRGLLAAGLVLFMSTLAFAAFFQGFETDTTGWFGATRVMSGTHGVPSKTGAFHAEDAGDPPNVGGAPLPAGAATARHFQSVGTPLRWTSISTFRLPT